MFLLFSILGWLGSFFLAICGAPQLIKSIKEKSCKDLSFCFLLLWFLGEGFCFIFLLYTSFTLGYNQLPLYPNYIFNIIITFSLLSLKIKHG